MTTANLLENSVVVAGEAVYPQVGILGEYVERIAQTRNNLRTEDEKKIIKVARAMKRSIPLIDVSVAIGAGGLHTNGCPRIGIAPYEFSMTKKPIQVAVRTNGSVLFSENSDWPDWTFQFPAGTIKTTSWFTATGNTDVPLVPLELRQRRSDDVILLYEVKEWRRGYLSPVDPYLLRKVAGNVYAVLGTWDITQNELDAFQAARRLGI